AAAAHAARWGYVRFGSRQHSRICDRNRLVVPQIDTGLALGVFEALEGKRMADLRPAPEHHHDAD
ncbi:hypothetical protein, partial [Rhodoplanes serenus]|uniref:hypothetical protein n=1 Tax=Rhodoplanes serenus TaxID=200615 RepID=UPI001AECA635